MVTINFNNLNGNFDATRPTYVLTHGWNSDAVSGWIPTMANTLRSIEPNANIISVDWSQDGAKDLNYFNAVSDTVTVGNEVANHLISIGANPTTTQLIGHSLGAHVSGIAGDRYDALTGVAIDTIVGLDPAGPNFENGGRTLAQRLDATDADRVVAFHTSETLGYDAALGDVDFYINWGDWFQPGQWNFSGNHSYAHQLYNEMLNGASFRQDTVNAAGSTFNLFDVNNDYLTGTIDVNTYSV